MKKVVVGIGVFLILIGVILAANFNVQRKIDLSEEADRQTNKWTVSGFFNESEKMGLYFVQPKDWSFEPYPDLGGPPYSKNLMINVTNEDTEQFTLFKVILVVPQRETPPAPPYAFILTIYRVEVEQQKGAIITVAYPHHTGQLIALGMTNSSGQYRIEAKLVPDIVIDENKKPKMVSPPLQLILYKVSTKYEAPYTFLLPIGLVITSIGVSIFVFGLRKKPRRNKRRFKASSKV